jgi:hypothetical protein
MSNVPTRHAPVSKKLPPLQGEPFKTRKNFLHSCLPAWSIAFKHSLARPQNAITLPETQALVSEYKLKIHRKPVEIFAYSLFTSTHGTDEKY